MIATFFYIFQWMLQIEIPKIKKTPLMIIRPTSELCCIWHWPFLYHWSFLARWIHGEVGGESVGVCATGILPRTTNDLFPIQRLYVARDESRKSTKSHEIDNRRWPPPPTGGVRSCQICSTQIGSWRALKKLQQQECVVLWPCHLH